MPPYQILHISGLGDFKVPTTMTEQDILTITEHVQRGLIEALRDRDAQTVYFDESELLPLLEEPHAAGRVG